MKVKRLSFGNNFTDPRGSKIDVYGYVEFDDAHNVGTYTTERRGPDTTTRTKISLKFTSFLELKRVMESCGLKVVEIWGSGIKSLIPKHLNRCTSCVGFWTIEFYTYIQTFKSLMNH